MARAIELKHSAGLCSALAHETSKMFTTAADALRTLDMGRVERWSRYLQLKAAVYTAYVSRARGQGCGPSGPQTSTATDTVDVCAARASRMAAGWSLWSGMWNLWSGMQGRAPFVSMHIATSS